MEMEYKCKDEVSENEYEEFGFINSGTTVEVEFIGDKLQPQHQQHQPHELQHQQRYYGFLEDAEDEGIYPRQKIRKLAKYDKCWTGDETESLIKLWSEQPELYDPSLPAYFDRGKKQLLMKEIAEKLEADEENVRKKMKSLQSYWCQLRRRDFVDKTNGIERQKRHSWPFYEMLEFLNVSGTSKPNCLVNTSTECPTEESTGCVPTTMTISPKNVNEIHTKQNQSPRQITSSEESFSPKITVPGDHSPRLLTTESGQIRHILPSFTTISMSNRETPTDSATIKPFKVVDGKNRNRSLSILENTHAYPQTQLPSPYNTSRPIFSPRNDNSHNRPIIINELINPNVPRGSGPDQSTIHHTRTLPALSRRSVSEVSISRSEDTSTLPIEPSISQESKLVSKDCNLISQLSEDNIFGELVTKSIAKIPDGEIKEELKIEIQQLILGAKRKASVL